MTSKKETTTEDEIYDAIEKGIAQVRPPEMADKVRDKVLWQPVELTPRLTQMNRIFASVKYKTPPSDKVTLGEGYLEVIINIPSDKDRFGVTEFGTFRFWFNEGRVEKHI